MKRYKDWGIRNKLILPLFAAVVLGACGVMWALVEMHDEIVNDALPEERSLDGIRRVTFELLIEYHALMLGHSETVEREIEKLKKEIQGYEAAFAETVGDEEYEAGFVEAIDAAEQKLVRIGDEAIAARFRLLDHMEAMESFKLAIESRSPGARFDAEAVEDRQAHMLGMLAEEYISELREYVLGPNDTTLREIAEIERELEGMLRAHEDRASESGDHAHLADDIEPIRKLIEAGRLSVALTADFVAKRDDLEGIHGELLAVLEETGSFVAIETDEAFETGFATVGMVIFAVLVIITLVGYTVTRDIVKSATALASAAGRLGGGDLNARADVTTKDEIGVMAAAFNKMAVSLESNIEQRERAERAENSLQTLNENLVTSRDQAEAANKALEAEMDQRKSVERQLIHSQKMEAIGQLTGGIAHDFNNLLMIIDGYARRALSNIGDMEIAGRSLEEVLAATERAASLTRQLLVFSRRQIMDKRVFPVADAVREIKGLLEQSVGERYGFEFKIADKKVCVRTDPGELSQAILNLTINARDAMPEGGKITIGVRVIDVDAEFIESEENMPEGRYVEISVTDKGCGMDETTMEHIFEPFFTTKEQGEGTGLGLSMAYGFARQSGGKLEVISEFGKGTTVHIYLPVVQRPPTLISIQDRTEHKGHGETILLVEDDNRLLELIHDMLCDLGYKVFVAGNGFEALEVDEVMEKPIDLLLSDVVMPSLGGFELYEILKERRPGMKAVFMSGYPKRGAGKVKIPENVPFLQKPVAPGQLAQVVWSEISRTLIVSSHAI